MDQDKLEKIKKSLDQNTPNGSSEFETELDVSFDHDMDFSNIDFSEVDDLNLESANLDNFELTKSVDKDQKSEEIKVKEIPEPKESTVNIVTEIEEKNQKEEIITEQKVESTVGQSKTVKEDIVEESTITVSEQDSKNSEDQVKVTSNVKTPEKSMKKLNTQESKNNKADIIRTEDPESVQAPIKKQKVDTPEVGRSRSINDSLFTASQQPITSVKTQEKSKSVSSEVEYPNKIQPNYKVKKPANKANIIPWIIFILLSLAIAFLAAYLYLSLNNINPTRIFNSNNYVDLTKADAQENLITTTQILGVDPNELTDDKINSDITEDVTVNAVRGDINKVIRTKEFANLGNKILAFNIE